MIVARLIWAGFFGILVLLDLQHELRVAWIVPALVAMMALPQFTRLLPRLGIAGRKREILFIVVAIGTIIFNGYAFRHTPGAIAKREQRERADELREKQRVADKAADEAARERSGTNCLSWWYDYYAPLVKYVKTNTRNPKTFEHIRTTILPVDEKGEHLVVMKYRAENVYGGMNIEFISAIIDHNSCDMKRILKRDEL